MMCWSEIVYKHTRLLNVPALIFRAAPNTFDLFCEAEAFFIILMDQGLCQGLCVCFSVSWFLLWWS